MSIYWMRARDGFPMTPAEEARAGRRSKPWGRKYHAFASKYAIGASPACGVRSVWADERLDGKGTKCEVCLAVLAALKSFGGDA